jgi:hypothetical protein
LNSFIPKGERAARQEIYSMSNQFGESQGSHFCHKSWLPPGRTVTEVVLPLAPAASPRPHQVQQRRQDGCAGKYLNGEPDRH